MKKLKFLSVLMLLLSTTTVLQSCKNEHNNDYRIDNQTFVNQASNSNNFEIVAGNIARTKGLSAEVKQYGEHMVVDHGAVGSQMMALAQSKGWTVPAALQPKEQALADTLNTLTGTALDKKFADIMVASHLEAIALFEDASSRQGVADGDLRNFAASKLPALKAHLEEAKTLQTQVK
jgi:putative membrane protein